MAATCFGFECPLDKPEADADFGVMIQADSRAAAFLREQWCSGRDPASSGMVKLLDDIEGEQVDPQRSPYGKSRIVLEYDVRSAVPGTRLNTPGFFLSPVQCDSQLHCAGRLLQNPGELADIIASGAGWTPDPAERSHVVRVYHALRSTRSNAVQLRSIGAFPSRAGRSIRLLAFGFDDELGAVDYLQRIGWPGPIPAVSEIVSRLRKRSAFAKLGLAVDICADGIGPLLGISFQQPRSWSVVDVRQWMPLADYLREEQLALPNKLAGMAKYSRTQLLFGRSGTLMLRQGVSHIKVVLGNTGRIDTVKVYLFATLKPYR